MCQRVAGAVLRSARRSEHKIAQLAALLGLAPPPLPTSWTNEADRARAETLLPGGDYVALGPTANWSGKIWPADRFVALFEGLRLRQPGLRPVVFAGPGEAERAMAAPVLASLPGAVDLGGRLSLSEASACLARCGLFVGNDSGLMHLAAAAGAPTLGLFGPTPAHEYAPRGRATATVLAEGGEHGGFASGGGLGGGGQADGRMRIAHVMAGAPSGGAELFFERLVVALHEAGDAVLPVIRRNAGRAERLLGGGVTPVQLAFGGTLDVLTPWRLGRRLRRFRPGLVMAWMGRAAAATPRGDWLLAGRLGGYYDPAAVPTLRSPGGEHRRGLSAGSSGRGGRRRGCITCRISRRISRGPSPRYCRCHGVRRWCWHLGGFTRIKGSMCWCGRWLGCRGSMP